MLVSALLALLIAGLVLWAVTQLPIDATIARLIRVTVIVCVVLYVVGLLTGRGTHLLH